MSTSYSSGTPSRADPCKSCAYCFHFCEFICALKIGGEGLSTLSTGDGGGGCWSERKGRPQQVFCCRAGMSLGPVDLEEGRGRTGEEPQLIYPLS